MSDERALSLAGYIEALIDRLMSAEPLSGARLRRIVGERSAVIRVDEEEVHVRFEGERLCLRPGPAEADGAGETGRQTVVDLLAGRTELTAAVRSGRLRLVGTTDGIRRMFEAVEILLDVSTRAPALQRLAERYRAESPDPSPYGYSRTPEGGPSTAQLALLCRLGLLPESGE